MKIIHLVLGKANPLRMNGVNKLVHEMACAQKSLGKDVWLWGITNNPVHDYPKRNFKTALFPSVFNKTRLDYSLKKAISDLDKDTIFHIHGSFIPEFYLISRILNKKGIVYVYSPHGALAPAALKRRNWKKKWYFEFFEKKLIEDSKSVITTGKSVFDNLDNLVKTNSKVLIPNGQPILDFKAIKIDPNQKLIFGYCGRIALEHKGLDLLLQGFREFLDRGGDAELHIVGDGPEMPRLQKIVSELNLKDFIHFYGAKYGEEKYKVLCQTNVFVHTSRMEGFPAAVLEAAALGLPCLVSKHTNFGDYVDAFKCGFVVEKNTPIFIADNMQKAQRFLENGQLVEMGKRAKKMVETEFDWKNICAKLLLVYEYKNHTSEIKEPVSLI